MAKIKKLKSDYKQKGKKVGIICTDETKNKYAEDTEKTIIKSLGSRKCPKTIAANLFSVLREFDKTGVETILCESVDSMEIGHAIMDRLEKAARAVL